MNDKYLTITALTRYLKHKFEQDPNLIQVYIKGEISNFKAHTTGHYYFSLKDDNSKINAIMFKTNASKLNFIPKEGMKVLVTGSIRIYEATGNYQIYVTDMIEDGVGNLYIAFEKLKKKLQAEGLFDPKYKKELPKIPSRIGIVTASTGAAIKDILSTINRRFPICETILFPSLVQGENAKEDIVEKIKQADNYNLDVLIVGRGGGSFEDLNCFNDEEVARTIFNAKTPIISAVGHEIDFTIADFVADIRAATPTAAAEIAVPNLADLLNTIGQYKIRLNNNITGSISYLKDMLKKLSTSYVLSNPLATFEIREQKLDELVNRLNTNIVHKLDVSKNRFDSIKNKRVLLHPEDILVKYNNSMELVINKLELLNPLNVLKKGYSVTKVNNKPLKSIKDVKEKDKLNIKIIDGEIDAIVEGVK